MWGVLEAEQAHNLQINKYGYVGKELSGNLYQEGCVIKRAGDHRFTDWQRSQGNESGTEWLKLEGPLESSAVGAGCHITTWPPGVMRPFQNLLKGAARRHL